MKDAWLRRGKVLRLVALVFLAWRLVLFVQYQVTGLLYPQLEALTDPGVMFSSSSWNQSDYASQSSAEFLPGGGGGGKSDDKPMKLNMKYDKQVRIQTGPALPEWSWRRATFSWRGPVNMKQTMHPVLLSSGAQRALILVRAFANRGFAGTDAASQGPQAVRCDPGPRQCQSQWRESWWQDFSYWG